MNMKQATLKQLNDIKLAMDLVQTAQQAHHNFPHLKANDLKFMMHPKNFTTGQTQAELLDLYVAVGKASGDDLDSFFNQLMLKLKMISTSARRTYNQALKGQDVKLGLDFNASKLVKARKTTSQSSHRKAHTKEASAVEYKNGFVVNHNPIVTTEYNLHQIFVHEPRTYRGKKYYRFALHITPVNASTNSSQYRSVLVRASNNKRVLEMNALYENFKAYAEMRPVRIVEQRSADNKYVNVIKVKLMDNFELAQRYGMPSYNA